MRCKRLPGLPVLTIHSGEHLGRVRRAVVLPTQKKVAALLVSTRGRFGKRLLPIESVHALGGHAVTVLSDDALKPLKDAADLAPLLREERVEVHGLPVVTARGELLGTVRDYEVEVDGAISSILIVQSLWQSLAGREAPLSGSMLLALGKDAVVVKDDALDLVQRQTHAERVAEKRPKDETAQKESGFSSMGKAVRDRLTLINVREREEDDPPPGTDQGS